VAGERGRLVRRSRIAPFLMSSHDPSPAAAPTRCCNRDTGGHEATPTSDGRASPNADIHRGAASQPAERQCQVWLG
jgi:hypothetical protein